MSEEPLLRGNEIQGDSLAGFRKDHVSLLFLTFNSKQIPAVKKWLRQMVPRLATLNAVAQFNDSFRMARRALRPLDPVALKPPEPTLSATWINIAFTAQGVTKLLGKGAVDDFEEAFRFGARARAATIGDPTDGSPGSPSTWLVGGTAKKSPDAMLNVASDDAKSLKSVVRAIRRNIREFGTAIRVIHEDAGNAKLAPTTGHEHFGFKDGVSQPGVRGMLDTPTNPLLTPRLIDDSDPLSRVFASPGVPLIQPGEFVLGYPRQNPNTANRSQPEDDTRTEPDWARDGSYVVYRRLRQNVAAFERFVEHGANALTAQGFSGITPDRFGAMCVGRWKDGTPIARSPIAPNADIARDRRAAQSFFFAKNTRPVVWRNPTRDPDTLPAATMDGDGQRCPLSAHVRKVNPRDEGTDVGQGARTLRRRIIRRGVTFGPSYAKDPQKERGLLFICYQASIADQFEFLWRVWSNGFNTPRADSGIDPILGQNGNGRPEARVANFIQDDKHAKVAIPERFVISTGGAYLFAPSISAIRDVLAAG
jgi:Dyp-type peroxidase family